MGTPRRIRIADSLGRTRTLASGPDAYERLAGPAASGSSVLILGLGPSPGDLAPLIEAADPVAYAECPDFERALPAPPAIPVHWQRIAPDEIAAFVRERRPAVWSYRQAARLFPEFWGPLMAGLSAPAGAARRPASRAVIVPGSERDLLHQEIVAALRAEGFEPLPFPRAGDLPRMLEREAPAFFLSVNLRGLDPEGETFHLLEAAGVPVAVWFADNPWHILSALRQPWWKRAALFVTDASFLPGLAAHGARNAHHLPLAASALFAPPQTPPGFPPGVRFFFAGRSAFPDRERFFAAARPPDALTAEAANLPPGAAHFHWWVERLGLAKLWPGADARVAGAGAEAASLRWRTLWLQGAAKAGLLIAGDNGWRALPGPGARLIPPVDYYGELPGLYRAAPYTLNATSLLLPGGLTQRHFDVWRAGGFLLTPRDRGLDIFPAGLADAIAVDSPDELCARADELDARPAYKKEIRAAWQDELRRAHTYRHRIRSIVKMLGVGEKSA